MFTTVDYKYLPVWVYTTGEDYTLWVVRDRQTPFPSIPWLWGIANRASGNNARRYTSYTSFHYLAVSILTKTNQA